jgi:hypothetical protein
MALMDKLKFWKKEEVPPEIPAMPDIPPPMAGQPGPPPMPGSMEQMGMPTPMPGLTEPPQEIPPAFETPAAPQAFAQQQQTMSSDQQMQLISSKLDTIKAQLETVLQRFDRLERKNEEHPYQQRWRTNI